jgi:hypothetical protein
MTTYVHNPTPVEAWQVKRPFNAVQTKVPLAHMVKSGSGAFSHFRVTLKIGEIPTARAGEGDWIIRHPDVSYEVMSDAEFQVAYGDAVPF